MAAWVEDSLTELCAFPHGRHDDQVDALSQLLGWMTKNAANTPKLATGAPRPLLQQR